MNYNLTDLRIAYYKIAKKMEINMTMCSDNEIEIYEEDRSKGHKFAEEVHKINRNCKVVDLIGSGLDVDVRGNTLKGSTSLYLVDDEHYAKLIGEEAGQMSLI